MICAIAAPAWAGQVINTPVLASARNFRDIAGISAADGGTGHPDAAWHGVLRSGVIYRSNALSLSPADQTTLAQLGIAEDIDLRTPDEIKRQPDALPPGIAFVNVNILAVQTSPKPNLASAPAAAQQMETYYRDFVTRPEERSAIRTALLDIAKADRPVVIHCSAGKDRTGWLAAIMRDYLASNRYTAAGVQAMLARVPAAQRPALAVLLSVQPQFLAAAQKSMVQNYGGMDGYLTRGIGLTSGDLARLRRRLVED